MKNKILALFIVLLLCVSVFATDTKPSSTATISEPNGLIAFWLMAENTGTNVEDYVSDANGTMSGYSSWTTGTFSGPAIDCNVGGYITKTAYAGLSNLSAFSLSIWFKIYTATDYDYFFTWQIDSTHNVLFGVNSSGYRKIQTAILNGSSNGYGITAQYGGYELNTWCHYVVVFNGAAEGDPNRLYYYKDGGAKATFGTYTTVPSSTATGSASLIFGHATAGIVFDNVSLYNRAITDAEAAYIHEHPFYMFSVGGGSPTNTRPQIISISMN